MQTSLLSFPRLYFYKAGDLYAFAVFNHFVIIRYEFPVLKNVFGGNILKGFWNNRHDFEDESQSAGCVLLSPEPLGTLEPEKTISQWEVREPVCFDSRCLAVHNLQIGE